MATSNRGTNHQQATNPPTFVDPAQRKKRYEQLSKFAKKIIPHVLANEGSFETPNGLDERLYFRGKYFYKELTN